MIGSKAPRMPRVVRAVELARTFLWMGFLVQRAYPLGFVMNQITPIFPVVVYAYVSRLVDSGPDVGGDYFTYAVLGFVSLNAFAAGMAGFVGEVDQAIQHGRFEVFLVEPVRWKALPVLLALAPVAIRLESVFIIMVFAPVMGAHYAAGGLPAAVALILLGTGTGVALGVLSASVRILSKRSDPVVTIYNLTAMLFGGLVFPVELLPSFLRPISWLLPHTYLVSALRSALMPGADALGGPSPVFAVGALVVFNLVIFPLALWTFGRSLNVGRRLGILAGY